jgi:hypothetical protein
VSEGIKYNGFMENKKMYLTQAEADAKGLPSIQEQIDRHNRAIADHREANEFAELTKKFGVDVVMEAPRLVYGTLGPQSGLSKQIWKLTGDKCSPSQYMLEFSDPWAARRKAIEIMRNITAEN